MHYDFGHSHYFCYFSFCRIHKALHQLNDKDQGNAGVLVIPMLHFTSLYKKLATSPPYCGTGRCSAPPPQVVPYCGEGGAQARAVKRWCSTEGTRGEGVTDRQTDTHDLLVT